MELTSYRLSLQALLVLSALIVPLCAQNRQNHLVKGLRNLLTMAVNRRTANITPFYSLPPVTNTNPMLDNATVADALLEPHKNKTDEDQARKERFSMSLFQHTTAALPECATQQVCNAIYMRLKRTQQLCSCGEDQHCSEAPYVDEFTIKLISSKEQQAFNLIKMCQSVLSVRKCRAPHDWQLLALQNVRTGKAHYLVICRCPTGSNLLGPVRHENPPFANIPGIRVYGMLCSQQNESLAARGVRTRTPSLNVSTPVQWDQYQDSIQKIVSLLK